jgi:hypothetical protein
MTLLTADTLLNIDFRVAKWVKADNGKGIDYVLDGANVIADRALLEVRNAPYAFVQGDEVKYIGKTARSIRNRFTGYCNPGKTERTSGVTNWRCHHNIKALLKEGLTTRILVFTPISHLRYGEFEIDLAAGLEEAMIMMFKPPWNGRDGTRPITEEAEREANEEADIGSVSESRSVQRSSAAPDSKTNLFEATSSQYEPTFQIKLGSAYYHQGFINPGTDASKHLGGHGDRIIVYLGSDSEQVDSVINRRANPNGSVRVVGNNRRIAEWFQRNFQPGDVVDAKVLDAQHIMLLPRIMTADE